MILMEVGWLSTEVKNALLITKGGLAFAGVILFAVHMTNVMGTVTSAAQKWRYWCLLGYAVYSASATTEQIADNVFGWRIFGALILNIALVATAVVSIREYKRNPNAC